jgi:hypothetical protein
MTNHVVNVIVNTVPNSINISNLTLNKIQPTLILMDNQTPCIFYAIPYSLCYAGHRGSWNPLRHD